MIPLYQEKFKIVEVFTICDSLGRSLLLEFILIWENKLVQKLIFLKFEFIELDKTYKQTPKFFVQANQEESCIRNILSYYSTTVKHCLLKCLSRSDFQLLSYCIIWVTKPIFFLSNPINYNQQRHLAFVSLDLTKTFLTMCSKRVRGVDNSNESCHQLSENL